LGLDEKGKTSIMLSLGDGQLKVGWLGAMEGMIAYSSATSWRKINKVFWPLEWVTAARGRVTCGGLNFRGGRRAPEQYVVASFERNWEGQGERSGTVADESGRKSALVSHWRKGGSQSAALCEF